MAATLGLLRSDNRVQSHAAGRVENIPFRTLCRGEIWEDCEPLLIGSVSPSVTTYSAPHPEMKLQAWL